jgi:hypothetical protein
MILNIVGTSGAGKSYLVRELLSWLETASPPVRLVPAYFAGRKAPVGYDFRLSGRKWHIVGSYEDADTAGCDSIRAVSSVFDFVRDRRRTANVLYEGLFVMNHTRGVQLVEEFGDDVCLLQLLVPLSMCISSIDARRAARGEGKLLNKSNTVGNFRRAENYCAKMRAAGARVVSVRRGEAFDVLLGLLKEG